MRLIISVLFFLVLSQPTMAAGSFEFIQCKATGLVDGITEIYFQPTDLEGQACGYLMNEKKNFTCFNGEIYDENLEILSLPHHFGSEELILSYDRKNKTYTFGKYFRCDFNHEEHCLPGYDELIKKELVQCELGILKH